ncbi:MAG: MBL fold metallo-hydrolase, partial [Verrucomicrobiales bacterium]|nr:MBL fold metallo-hydrolase [Verrucomicrobiales bacterium]
MKIETYTGGAVQTNAYLIHAPEGLILVDAPEGVCEWLGGREPAHLLLTHGHYDHMFDAARVKKQSGCKVWVHDDSRSLVEHPEAMVAFSPYESIEPIKPDHLIEETRNFPIAGIRFETFLCPGHCPGS